MALRNKFLQSRLQGAVRVQNTVAVPFGAIKQIMSAHHENGRSFGVIQRAMDKFVKARDEGTATVDHEKNVLRTCRCILLFSSDCDAMNFADMVSGSQRGITRPAHTYTLGVLPRPCDSRKLTVAHAAEQHEM